MSYGRHMREHDLDSMKLDISNATGQALQLVILLSVAQSAMSSPKAAAPTSLCLSAPSRLTWAIPKVLVE